MKEKVLLLYIRVKIWASSRFLFESLTASLSLILIISHFCSPCWFVLVFSDSLGLLTDQPSVCTFPNAGWQRLFLDFIFFTLLIFKYLPNASRKSRHLNLGMTNSGKILLPWTFKFLDRWHLSRSTDLISILTSKYLG